MIAKFSGSTTSLAPAAAACLTSRPASSRFDPTCGPEAI
jgi:hypothetical protein